MNIMIDYMFKKNPSSKYEYNNKASARVKKGFEVN